MDATATHIRPQLADADGLRSHMEEAQHAIDRVLESSYTAWAGAMYDSERQTDAERAHVDLDALDQSTADIMAADGDIVRMYRPKVPTPPLFQVDKEELHDSFEQFLNACVAFGAMLLAALARAVTWLNAQVATLSTQLVQRVPDEVSSADGPWGAEENAAAFAQAQAEAAALRMHPILTPLEHAPLAPVVRLAPTVGYGDEANGGYASTVEPAPYRPQRAVRLHVGGASLIRTVRIRTTVPRVLLAVTKSEGRPVRHYGYATAATRQLMYGPAGDRQTPAAQSAAPYPVGSVREMDGTLPVQTVEQASALAIWRDALRQVFRELRNGPSLTPKNATGITR